MAFDPEIGERAMLLRNHNGDWAVCVARWHVHSAGNHHHYHCRRTACVVDIIVLSYLVSKDNNCSMKTVNLISYQELFNSNVCILSESCEYLEVRFLKLAGGDGKVQRMEVRTADIEFQV